MKATTGIPDGTRLKTHDRVLVIFSPPWWRIDRWIFWACLVAFAETRQWGVVKVSSMERDEGGAQRLEEDQIRAYEERA